jgi:hypothetical protein
MYPSIHPSIYVSIHLSIYVSIHLPIYVSIYLSISACLSTCRPFVHSDGSLVVRPCIDPSVYPFLRPSGRLSSCPVRPPAGESDYPSVRLTACPTFLLSPSSPVRSCSHLPTYLPTYLPACLPTYLPACLPACLSTYLRAYLLTCLPTYLRTYLPTFLPTCLPTYLPTYLLPKTNSVALNPQANYCFFYASCDEFSLSVKLTNSVELSTAREANTCAAIR